MRQTYLVLVIIDRIRRFFFQSYFGLFYAILFRVWLYVCPFPQPVSCDSYRACVLVIECVCVISRVRNSTSQCVRSRCLYVCRLRECVYTHTNYSQTVTHTHTHTRRETHTQTHTDAHRHTCYRQTHLHTKDHALQALLHQLCFERR
jgi:hypothetical protein